MKSLQWYHGLAVFFLLQVTGALSILDRLVYGDRQAVGAGDKVTQGLNLLLIATSVVLFGRAVRRTRGVGMGGFLAVAMVAFLMLSALWSLDPAGTVRRAMIYLFVVIGAIGIAGNLRGNEFMDLLGTICFLSAILSLFLLLVSPGNALMPDGTGDLRGIFTHKNVLGEVMAAGALASLHGLRAGKRRRARNIAMLVVFCGTALLSKSATSWMTIFAYSGINVIIGLFRMGGVGRIFGILSIIVLVPVITLVAVDPDPLLEMLGKNPTLTGRTELWPYVINDIFQKPLLGWGYSAFWGSLAAREISDALGWVVPEAHNGLLEMLLEVGGLGTAFFLFLFLRNGVIAFQCRRSPAKDLGISLLQCCLGILLVGVTEQVLLDPFLASVSIFFIAGLSCERSLRAWRDRRGVVLRRAIPRGLRPVVDPRWRGLPAHAKRRSLPAATEAPIATA